MAHSTDNIIVESTSVLPLHHLVAMLRQHGFVIRPDDYIEMLKVVQTFGQDGEIDAALLCPLIATSPEEQERFYRMFQEYKATAIITEEGIAKPIGKSWFQRHKWRLLIGIVFIALALAVFFSTRKPSLRLIGDLAYQNLSTKEDTAERVGDTVQFDAAPLFANADINTSDVEFFWNDGGGFKKGGSTNAIVLSKPGPQQMQVKLRSSTYEIKDSLASVSLSVCPQAPRPEFTFNQETYALNDELTIQPIYPANNQFAQVRWKVNDAVIPAQADGSLRVGLDSSGIYTIEFLGFLQSSDNENSPCIFSKRFDDIIIANSQYSLQTSSSGQPLTASIQKQLHPLMNWLLLVPAILIAIGTAIWWLMKRKKKGNNVLSEPPRFTGKKPPYETPFENKDLKLTEPESGFREVFRSFRQKAEDEATIFNVTQSIQRTIRGGGMPELVFTNKLRYTDYLILIDRSMAKSMQVRLFDYLVKLLNEEAVNVERFYYSGRFEKIYNEAVPDGYSLKRLAELYKTHTLIIMGHAHQLVFDAYSVLDKSLADVLFEWEYKAILTPVPFKDWTEKEKIVAEKIVLLPADLQGQLRLLQATREKSLDHRKYLSSITGFYETGSFDFGSIEDVKSYLQDNMLFQWLCATAVYHKLRWEVLIEIGKAVCSANKQPEKMNFSNLLKLSRISWMNDGAFPAGIRMELLKHLKPENEVIARESLLQMFQYADTYFGAGYFFEEEKEVQKITSRFLLFAHDQNKYAQYAEDQQLFKALWENGKLWDTPQKAYLENPRGDWSSLLQAKGKSTGVNQFFNAQKQAGIDAVKRVVRRNASVAMSLVLVLTLFHLVKGSLPPSLPLIKAKTSDASLTITLSDTIQCEDNDAMQSLQGDLVLNNGTKVPLLFNERRQATASFRNGDLTDTTGLMELRWNNGKPVTTTSLVRLSSQELRVNLSACKPAPNYTVNIVYNDTSRYSEVQSLAQFLKQQGYDVKNSSFENIDSSSAVYYFRDTEQQGADSLSQILSLQFGALFSNAKTVKDASSNFGRQKTLGILVNFRAGRKAVLTQFDNRLNEIWKGSTNNRLIAINYPVVYYSTGDKQTYGTYRIEEVWDQGTGMYKLITDAGSGYQVMMIRNIQANSFDFSFCPARYTTKEEARGIDERWCYSFDQVNPYYEKDDAKIFLPLNARSLLESGNNNKLKKLQAKLNELNRQQGSYVSLKGSLYYNSRYKRQVPAGLPGSITQTTPMPNLTPFDRSYIQYAFLGTPTVQPDCNKVYTSLAEASKLPSPLIVCRLNLAGQGLFSIPKPVYRFTNLQELDLRRNSISEREVEGFLRVLPKVKVLYDKRQVNQTPERLLTRIQLNEKGIPDGLGESRIQQILAYLGQYPEATVRMVFHYSRTEDEKQMDFYQSQVRSTLSRYSYNPRQVRFENGGFTTSFQTQQNNMPISYGNDVYIEVFGTNFPNDFLQPRSKKD